MGYAASLPMMIHWTDQVSFVWNDAPAKPEFGIFMKQSSILPEVRNHLVADAIGWGANYLLWIDSDMVFPTGALVRLLSLNFPIVGANYPRRDVGTSPTATGIDGQRLWTTKELADAEKVEEVLVLGLGFCLIDMTVIHKISDAPFFDISATDTEFVGEDVHFCRRIREAGIPIHVDHSLSWQVGHTMQRTLTFAEL